ncbi:MAG: hypothetical protein WC740_24220 [Verrucomicrobiia bacterium]
MNVSEYSGELRCSEDVITYRSSAGDWSVPIAEIRIIGEYTNTDGPYIDDYFFVFLTAPEGGWHQASFYAKGSDETLAALSRSLGARSNASSAILSNTKRGSCGPRTSKVRN